MTSSLIKIQNLLNKKNIPYINEENSVLFTLSARDNDDYQIEFVSYEGNNQICLHLEFNRTIPEEKRPIVAEYITRINNRLPIGALKMNFNTGDVYYKVSNILNGQLLTNKIINRMVGEALFSMDISSPGFKAICNEGKSAIDAFKIVENARFMNKFKAIQH
jgi:hypothetical protein